MPHNGLINIIKSNGAQHRSKGGNLMRPVTQLVVCAAAVVLSAILFHFADSWFSERTSALAVGRRIMFEMHRSQALQERAKRVARSISIKHETIVQLVGGRLCFHQAIVQFQKANDIIENVDLDLIPAYCKPTDPEGVGRQVYDWAYYAVATWPPNKTQRFLAGLENEFQHLFGRAIFEEVPRVRPVDYAFYHPNRGETHGL